MNNNLPNDWSFNSIGDIASIFAGGTPSRDNPEYYKGNIPWVKSGEVNARQIFDTSEHISMLAVSESSARMAPAGSVLLAMYGATAGQVAKLMVDATLNQAVSAINAKCDLADNDYLIYTLEYNTDELLNRAQGSGQPNLSGQLIKGLKVPLPPLPEQQKIAAILTSVDEVIEKTQAQIDKLKDLKTGMMQELLTLGVGIDGTPHTEFKDSPVGRIPKEWEVVTMREICVTRQGLQIPISNRYTEPAENRFVYLTIKFINTGFNPAVAQYIQNPSKRVICNEEDIILARTGATGKVVTGVSGVFHNNFFMVDYNRNKVKRSYLVQYLNSPYIQSEIKNRAGTTTIPDLNHGDFYSMPMLIPSIEEQSKIADILEANDNLILNKTLKLNALIATKKALMQDLLTGKVRVNVGASSSPQASCFKAN